MASGYPDWHKGVKSDIIAQTIDLIKTSIDAVTVDKFDVDIVAQTIAQLGIDIKAQSIEEIIQFQKIGTCYSDDDITTVEANRYVDVVSVTGRGWVWFVWVLSQAATDSEDAGFDLILDGNDVIPFLDFETMNAAYLAPETAPLRLLTYGKDADCAAMLAPQTPLTFDSSMVLRLKNTSPTYDLTISWAIVYSLL